MKFRAKRNIFSIEEADVAAIGTLDRSASLNAAETEVFSPPTGSPPTLSLKPVISQPRAENVRGIIDNVLTLTLPPPGPHGVQESSSNLPELDPSHYQPPQMASSEPLSLAFQQSSKMVDETASKEVLPVGSGDRLLETLAALALEGGGTGLQPSGGAVEESTAESLHNELDVRNHPPKESLAKDKYDGTPVIVNVSSSRSF